jgi:hypothetical protein
MTSIVVSQSNCALEFVAVCTFLYSRTVGYLADRLFVVPPQALATLKVQLFEPVF